MTIHVVGNGLTEVETHAIASSLSWAQTLCPKAIVSVLMCNIRYPILLILLLLGKDLLREVARIPIDNVDCVPVEIKHL